jgi:hypothetical protein
VITLSGFYCNNLTSLEQILLFPVFWTSPPVQIQSLDTEHRLCVGIDTFVFSPSFHNFLFTRLFFKKFFFIISSLPSSSGLITAPTKKGNQKD